MLASHMGAGSTSSVWAPGIWEKGLGGEKENEGAHFNPLDYMVGFLLNLDEEKSLNFQLGSLPVVGAEGNLEGDFWVSRCK